MHGTVTYSSHELKYRLRFSARRTMAITVHPDGAIEVVAPRGSNLRKVEARVRRRARWIIRQRLYFEQFRPRSKPRRYVGGETQLFLGRQYRLKIIKGDCKEVKLKGGYLVVTLDGRAQPRQVRELIRTWYQDRARALFQRRFEAIGPRFSRLGCRISSPIIRRMSRRWGSYSRSGKILLNPDLVQAPSACVDYVIVHELAHIVHPNHGPKFYELIEAMMPDWKGRKHRLERVMA